MTIPLRKIRNDLRIPESTFLDVCISQVEYVEMLLGIYRYKLLCFPGFHYTQIFQLYHYTPKLHLRTDHKKIALHHSCCYFTRTGPKSRDPEEKRDSDSDLLQEAGSASETQVGFERSFHIKR